VGLTLEVEQILTAVGLAQFYHNDPEPWNEAAQNAYDYVRGNFPAGSTIRRDDVAKALTPVIEVRDDFRNKLNELKLRQKYWVDRFADFIIDRAWATLTQETQHDVPAGHG
jgi:hypothetical protein